MDIPQQQQALRRTLRSRGIIDERVLDVIATIRRDRFVPERLRERAYEDNALPIGAEQTISQPYIVALMTQELLLRGDEVVLEIGTGSGYQTAILAQLCQHVVTVERLEELAEPARRVLDELGYNNIEYWTGDGTLGCPERAPFDGIIVTAAAPAMPQPLYEQLNIGGRMVIPIGDEVSQSLEVIQKTETRPETKTACECRFVKLIGAAGWRVD
jgi:protein-L-isoaspartate(D-aspartate) O-methyltransferase